MNKILSNPHLKKWVAWAKIHKVSSFVIAVLVLSAGYSTYSKLHTTSTQTHYVLGTAEKATIVSSVSASGQVSSSNELAIKSKVSGDVVYVGVIAGQKVSAGTLIAELDARDAQKSVRDAQANLESAQIALEKLQKPASQLTLTQAQNALTNAQSNLATLYSNSQADIASSFVDLPDIILNLKNILTGSDAASSQWNIDYYKNAVDPYDIRAKSFRDAAYSDYLAAQASYDAMFNDYQALSISTDKDSIEKVLKETYDTSTTVAKAVKSANGFIQLYIDTYKAHGLTHITLADTQITNLNTYSSKLASHLSSLLSDTNSLTQDKQAITEKQESLNEITAGADSLDLRSAQLNVTKAENALQDANNTLANYFIRAPFDGVIGQVSIKKYDSAGNSAAIATLITNQKIAELSLNEVDAAKIKEGDKTTLTFDAIDGLTLTGKVAEVDTVGTVSQGVVSYAIKIGFDSQDERIRSGMTANASIITDVHADVLSVPSSAVKTLNGQSFVQVFTPPLTDTGGSTGVVSATSPGQVSVEVGISDDTNTEITSGLDPGEQIVTRTISGTTKTTTQTAPSLFGGGNRTTSGGTRAAGGNAVFISR